MLDEDMTKYECCQGMYRAGASIVFVYQHIVYYCRIYSWMLLLQAWKNGYEYYIIVSIPFVHTFCVILSHDTGEQSCPEFCLCLEAFFCVGPSMSTSRMYVMDKHGLGYDPCDNRMIRFSNCSKCCGMFACVPFSDGVCVSG